MLGSIILIVKGHQIAQLPSKAESWAARCQCRGGEHFAVESGRVRHVSCPGCDLYGFLRIWNLVQLVGRMEMGSIGKHHDCVCFYIGCFQDLEVEPEEVKVRKQGGHESKCSCGPGLS